MASIVRDCNPRCCNIYGCTHIDMFHNQFLSRNCFSKNLNLDGEETIHHAHHTHSLTTTRGIGRLKVHAHSSRSILMVSSELQDDQDLRIFMISATCQKRGSFFNLGCRSCRSFIQWNLSVWFSRSFSRIRRKKNREVTSDEATVDQQFGGSYMNETDWHVRTPITSRHRVTQSNVRVDWWDSSQRGLGEHYV
jgi:hypothetical protein